MFRKDWPMMCVTRVIDVYRYSVLVLPSGTRIKDESPPVFVPTQCPVRFNTSFVSFGFFEIVLVLDIDIVIVIVPSIQPLFSVRQQT